MGAGRVHGRVQLSCGHVDIDRMIIQIKAFPFLFGGGGGKRAEQGYSARYASHPTVTDNILLSKFNQYLECAYRRKPTIFIYVFYITQ